MQTGSAAPGAGRAGGDLFDLHLDHAVDRHLRLHLGAPAGGKRLRPRGMERHVGQRSAAGAADRLDAVHGHGDLPQLDFTAAAARLRETGNAGGDGLVGADRIGAV